MSHPLPAVAPINGGYVVKRTPGRVHATFEKAGQEAARLSQEHPDGPAYMVLEVVGMVTENV